MAEITANGMPTASFPSKKDWWLGLFLGLVVLLPLAMQLIYFQWIVVAVMLPVVGFLSWIWFGTCYRIDDQQLVVRSGPFVYRVPLESISSVKPTRNPFSSPALSLDRLAVRYNRYSELLHLSGG
jgi:ATP/ADP translocase